MQLGRLLMTAQELHEACIAACVKHGSKLREDELEYVLQRGMHGVIRFWRNSPELWDKGGAVYLDKAYTDAFHRLDKALLEATRHYCTRLEFGSDSNDTEDLDTLELDFGKRVVPIGMTWYSREDYGQPLKRFSTLREAIASARSTKKA